jgi:hypothetical protein
MIETCLGDDKDNKKTMGNHGDNEMTPRDVENMPRMLGNVKETSRMSNNTREIMEMLGKIKKMPRHWDFFKATMKGC